jgi:ligand-binding sensor domain-containing protein
MAFDSKGNLWCGTDGGLFFFNGQDWHFISNRELSGEDISSGLNDFVISSDDTIWLVIKTRILIKYKDELSTIYKNEYLSQKMDAFLGTRLFMDSFGTLWIGGKSLSLNDSYPLLKFNETGWEVFDLSGSDFVTDITQALDGSIWIGSAGAVYHYQP